MRSISESLRAAREECLVLVGNSETIRNRVNDIFDRLSMNCRANCDASDARHAEECTRLQECTREQYQDHIDDLVEELANCREDASRDRQTIQALVAVLWQLIK